MSSRRRDARGSPPGEFDGLPDNSARARDLPAGVSIVIPVFNSATSLAPLVERVEHVLDNSSLPYELVLVEDGSRDDSWAVIRRLAADHPYLRAFTLQRNYGQHNALLCGIRAARFDTICTIDDDLQHPPEEIPRLLDALRQGADVVYGAPLKETHGLWRDVASQVTKITLRQMMGAETARHVGPFRVFRTRIRDAFANYHAPYVSVDVLLTWGGSRFDVVRVRHDPRSSGHSNYTFGKLMTHALNMLTGFSTVPLRLASLLGFAFTIFGGIVLAYVLGRYLVVGVSVPGFAFLASTIAIFAGVQLFSLGIMGEYLARIHFRTLDKPAYSVADSLESGRSS